MSISDWSSDVCSSDLSQVKSCCFPVNSLIIVTASASFPAKICKISGKRHGGGNYNSRCYNSTLFQRMVGKFVIGFFSRDDHADNPPNGEACKHANSGIKEKVNLCIGLHQQQYHKIGRASWREKVCQEV